MKDKIIYEKNNLILDIINEISKLDSYPPSDYEYTDLINREEVIGLLKSKLSK